MHRRTLILAATASLAACVTHERPDAPGDACSMFERQDGWWRAVRRAERRRGARPGESEIEEGLDLTQHGERIVNP